MKTIKSNKSQLVNLEDLIEDELNKKCKKDKKKKHKSSKKSSHKKDNKKKIKKKYDKSIGADFFLLDLDEMKQSTKDFKNDKIKKKSFIDKLLEAINLDTKLDINITDESVTTIVSAIVGLITTLVSRKK